MATSSEHISAIAALTRIAEIKTLRILEDYSYLTNIPLVKEINADAVHEIGVDLFETNNPQSIKKYIVFLNQQVRKNILNVNSKSGIDDELELLNNTSYINPSRIRDYKVKFYGGKSDDTREVLQAIRLTKPDVVSLIRNSEYAQILSATKKSQNIFLLSITTKVRLKPCIILFTLIEEPIDLLNISFEKKLLLTSIYVFEPNNKRINSPVRLFLQMLEKYGYSSTLGFKTQKFYYSGFAPGVNYEMFRKTFPSGIHPPLTQGGIRETPLGMEYYFFYVIDARRMITNFKSLNFI